MTWYAVGTAAVSLISSYMGKRAQDKAMKKSAAEKQMENILAGGAAKQSAYGGELVDLSREPISRSQKWLHAASTGDINTLMELAGPELSNISSGARQTLQTMTQLGGRNGPSSEFLSELPFGVQAQQSQVLADTRNNARNTELSLGTNLASLGGSFLSGANTGAGSVLDYNRTRSKDAFNQGSAAAAGTYQILQNIMSAYQQGKAKQPGTTPSAGGASAGGFFGGGGITYN